jgi:addiction module HigA family antidote
MEISNSQHPFEFVLNRFIRPMGLTQAKLQKDLKVGAKTLSELYNKKRRLSPLMAIKIGKYLNITPELLMRMQIEYDLALIKQKNKQNISVIKPYHPEKNSAMLTVSDRMPGRQVTVLLSLVNNSVSNKEKHYTNKDLENLFHTQRFTLKKKYAVRILFSEASVEELIHFIRHKKIPFSNFKSLYHYYKFNLNGEENEKLEWLFR